ncbi:MAG: cytochrome c [Thermodesulfobacteriota bacterium]
MGFIKTVIFVLILLIAGMIVFIYSGTYNIAATEPHSLLVEWVFNTAKKYSVKKHSENITRPKLSDDSLVKAGFDHYENMCAGCHGAPGTEPAEGFNPSPPDLAEKAEELSSTELFWVTKNGIKMTGMPAFGLSHSDQEIWSIVAFLKQLPDLTPEDYDALKNNGSFDFDIPPEDEEFYKHKH